MTFPEFSISLGGSILLFVLSVGIAMVATILFYRTTIPPIPLRKKLFLASLRGCALALVLFLVFEPLLKLLYREEQEARLAVLIDASESMAIRDRLGERSESIRAFLRDKGITSSTARVSYFQFAADLTRIDPFLADSLQFAGETTDLSTALLRLHELRARENIQAALLLSDGVYTLGRNPIAAADNLDIPLYTIGVGDTLEQRDILVATVTTNDIVYAETRVPVDVRVRSSGFENEKVEVTLTHGPSVVDRKILQLQEGSRDYIVNLFYEPKEEGTQKYTVSVSSLRGELTEKNNVASFFVKVLKTKLRILLVAGAPSPDVATVRQTLSEEHHFTVRAFVQKRSGEFYEGALSAGTLDSADCIVLLGFPSGASSTSQIQLLSSSIERTKKPLLFVSSRRLDFEKLRAFEAVLPFSWAAPIDQELLVFAEVTERERNNALVQLNGEITAEHWQQLPPIFKTQTTFRAKPEADVLAFARIQSIVLNEPLVLTRNIARQKSFAIAGHGVWRWRLLAQGNPRTERFLPLLLTNAIRWLTTADAGKRVRAAPLKETFTTAEPIEFTGEVYDEQLRPIENAEMRITAGAQGERSEIVLRSIGSGRYEGSFGALSAGDYTFTAKAMLNGTNLGEDRGKFTVGQMNVEFLETKMNRQLLEQLAFRTGGVYADLAEAGVLVDSLHQRTQFTPKEIVHTSELELWNWQYLIGLLTLLLALEWFVRKRSGML